MSYTFNPDNGPPRLLRFVSPDAMPSADTLTLYDAKNNLVIINKEIYDTLDVLGKRMAERATTSLVMA